MVPIKTGLLHTKLDRATGKIFFQNNTVLITHSGWYVNDQAVKVNGLVTLGDEVGLNLNAVADSVALEAFTKIKLLVT